jgi:hypothetical protein
MTKSASEELFEMVGDIVEKSTEQQFWAGERDRTEPELAAVEVAKEIILEWLERLPAEDHYYDKLDSDEWCGEAFAYDILKKNVKHAVKLLQKHL